MNTENVPISLQPPQYGLQAKLDQICGDLENVLSLYRENIGLPHFEHNHTLYRLSRYYCREQYESHGLDLSGLAYSPTVVPLNIQYLSRVEITKRGGNALLKEATEHVESPFRTSAAVACYGTDQFIYIAITFL